MSDSLTFRFLGKMPYEPVWHAMQAYTDNRSSDSADEIWFVEHEPVFTQGQAGKEEHILNVGAIPIVQVDRGGQVTYHGPGQLVAYILVDIKRKKMGVRQLVTAIEDAIIATLADYDIDANADPKAPGVYVDGRKIASLGLRIRKGCSFHGLALNINMDLSPFQCINPCGYAGLEMVQTSSISELTCISQAEQGLMKYLQTLLAATEINQCQGLESV